MRSTMLPTLGGSFEESPPSLIDVGCAGPALVPGQPAAHPGDVRLRIASRRHASISRRASWAMSSSPLVDDAIAGRHRAGAAGGLYPAGIFLAGIHACSRPGRASTHSGLSNLFGVTMAVLLAPKLFGLLLALFDGVTRRASGGTIRLVDLRLFVEVVMSALFAPIMMLIQSGSVMQIVFGRDTGWNPQRRDDGSIPFADIAAPAPVACGARVPVAGGRTWPSRHLWSAWMSPTIARTDPGHPAVLGEWSALPRARPAAARPAADS